ncbi:hypothetical protein F3Y22_tig00111238pilonHSYRG00078 [Hibiscus syriacus]|uniref:Dof-type domain-containing protein n=1 Tax=Hibiscus syriacus TaxID=106335 RepID=A0A6A2YTR5_HIBSY|nr:hypothetical protein F3Y22_tig00111238pilonHSYRG00078 [Hibiscus syriacus]
MDSSTRQHQEMGNSSLENLSVNSNGQQERKTRPQHEEALKCPRCESTNTKFCYYNRWVQEEQKINIKEKPRSTINTYQQPTHHNHPPPTTTHLPPLNYDTNDLSLAFARLQKQPSFPLGFDDLGNPSINSNPTIVDALRSRFLGNQNDFHNFYYGVGYENMGFNGELTVPYNNNEMSTASTVTPMKQELSMADFDSEKEIWNGFNSSWHGLLNSPLM